MNFSYIIESILHPEVSIQPIACELDPKWKAFETELGRFKSEFASARAELTRAHHNHKSRTDELNVLRMMIENINSEDLKESISSIVDKYETEEGISALAQQCGEAAGKVAAMRSILMDTNAERYAKFTCFVCMDRLVDLFIEPCGHVMCEPCWARTLNKDTCPGCRTACTGTKRIYSMT